MFSRLIDNALKRHIRDTTWVVASVLLVTVAAPVTAQEPAPAVAPGAAQAPAAAVEGAANGAAVDSTAPPTAPLTELEIAADSFQPFCTEWLEKLVQREQQNSGKIEWVTSDLGVRGTYTGYSRNGRCETKRGTDAVPIGKLTYKQITYEKKGINLDAAEVSAARPLTVDEVTEIFHYADGKWIY